MMSSGGGGFGAPGERSLEHLRSDLIDGLITAAGLTAYDATVMADGNVARQAGAVPQRPLLVRFDALASVVDCRISACLAQAQGIAPGRIIELFAPTGPALRLWVLGVFPAEQDEIRISELLKNMVAEGQLRLRILDSFFPRSVPA